MTKNDEQDTDETGDELLEEWRAAKEAHKNAKQGEKDEAFIRVTLAEKAAINHFGLKKHKEAYQAKYPDEKK